MYKEVTKQEITLRQDIDMLEKFYGSKLGLTAQSMVLRRLHAVWPHLEGCDVLGYGYDLPYLGSYKKGAHRIIHAMPGGQGAALQKSKRGNTSLLVEEAKLPFMPGVFDRVLVVHGLEETPDLTALFAELWRVMKPQGRIVIIAANRAGLWARSDKTPFGAGRPFSRTQLSKALKRAGFVTMVRSGALYSPPLKAMCGKRMSAAVETFGETVWPGFSGLVLVEAVKRLYAGHDSRERTKILRPRFVSPLGAQMGTKGKIYQPQGAAKAHEKS